MKKTLLVISTMLVLGSSFSSFAQSSGSCMSISMKVKSGKHTTSVFKGCESDNTSYTKLGIEYKTTTASIETVVDSRNYPESRATIEQNTIEMVNSGIKRAQIKFLKANVYPLLEQAMDSQTSEERELLLGQSREQVKELLLNN